MEPTETQLLKIGEVARRTGFSVKTLYHYEKKGLVEPADRTEAGHRLYGDEELARLVFVARAKRLGLALGEISELLTFWSDGSCSATREHLQRLMVDKLREVHREIEELVDFGEQLEEAHEGLAGHAPYERCNPRCGCPPDIRRDEKLTHYGSVTHRLRSLGGCE
jgi:MerR family copper efflux transcriptional regulator